MTFINYRSICVLIKKMITKLLTIMLKTNQTNNDNQHLTSDNYKEKRSWLNLCYVSVLCAFVLGLIIGVALPVIYLTQHVRGSIESGKNNSQVDAQLLKSIFINNSYSMQNSTVDPVKFIDRIGVVATTTTMMDVVVTTGIDDGIVSENIYWGSKVEDRLPKGYNKVLNDEWNKFIQTNDVYSESAGGNIQIRAVRLEYGCGRMQNRLITFNDGSQACVRYRQNTDQIQGELFSFYLAQILELPNLAPSTISIVDLQTQLWAQLSTEISSAQWNSNRPVVLTKYINNLDSAHIPNNFKPIDRHLNKHDIYNMTLRNADQTINDLIELAQWSDLIIFDYLTANLDRIVNNLYNFQWNVNIMDAPAHNLAKKLDNKLLIFLDNESGLLHGYRLLKKYEIYHTLLLDNLCMFRKQTASIVKQLYRKKNIGALLKQMFEEQNSTKVRDILPPLPDKSIKILNERIEHVYNQILKCELKFGNISNSHGHSSSRSNSLNNSLNNINDNRT